MTTRSRPHRIFACGVLAALACVARGSQAQPVASGFGADSDWAHYLGHPGSTQYSRLDNINKDNVHRLEEAWTYETGDSAEYQTNNLIVEEVLYTATPSRRVTALDAATGEPLWTFDPDAVLAFEASKYEGAGLQRGLMVWSGGETEGRRVFTSKGPWLYALDATTGGLVASFGEGGRIHLGDYVDAPGRPNVGFNTPGYAYGNTLIFALRVGEDVPGAVIAIDARTGERVWIFHTLPRPGEPGSETWPEGYLEHTGGASDWSGIAIDVARGIVYSSTETAGPDFYGGKRFGENLYANSLVALDVRTGERLWHYQLVHHDLWDMDNPAPPTLLSVMHEGERVDVVAQGTKMGLLFVFDRVTGEPLWPIEERPAPASKLPDVKTWPTQPFPTKPEPLMRQRYTEADLSTISEEARRLSEETFARLGSHGSFPPPSLEPTIKFPGYDGGMEWGGSAADPEGILYVNINEMPWFYRLIPTRGEDGTPLTPGERYYRVDCASCHGLDGRGDPGWGFPSLIDVEDRYTREQVEAILTEAGGRMPSFDALPAERRAAIIGHLFGDETPPPSDAEEDEDLPPYAFAGFQRFLDAEGYPAIEPPWGTLNAVDLNTGEIKWRVPLGEYEALTARGIPPTGTENYGGPVVTAGGLLFIGATADETFRAFDKDTGEVLWEADLPFSGNATPSTYMVGGRQFVVIAAGGGRSDRPTGGSLVAFALPIQ